MSRKLLTIIIYRKTYSKQHKQSKRFKIALIFPKEIHSNKSYLSRWTKIRQQGKEKWKRLNRIKDYEIDFIYLDFQIKIIEL